MPSRATRADALRRWRREDFARPVVKLARALLGCRLRVDGVEGTIVETEAYHEEEPSCHAHRGRTPRTEVLFWAPGHLYVYRIHQSFCLNVTAERDGVGAAVLIRGLEPRTGLERIAARRGGRPRRIWTDGPGKLCQALAVDLADNGRDLEDDSRVAIFSGPWVPDGDVEVGPRIGISKAQELPWRFFVPRGKRSAG